MRILVVPSTFDCLNLGDVAMLQVTVARLSELHPEPTIQVFTQDASKLAVHCPDAAPVVISYERLRTWFADHFLLGSYHKRLPRTISRRLIQFKGAAHHHYPTVVQRLIFVRLWLRNEDGSAFREFQNAVNEADLLVVIGNGGIGDLFNGFTNIAFSVLDMALRRGIPTAVVCLGLGPLHDQNLRMRAARVFLKVQFIGLREQRKGPSLLSEFGVSHEKFFVTGDEAVELAFNQRSKEMGNALGVNLRLAGYAGVGAGIIEQVQPVLQGFYRAHEAPLLAVPIAFHGAANDPAAIRQLLAGTDHQTDGGECLDSTPKLLSQIGRCRVVLTGAYHAAVFALAQGIPVVCLSNSEFYDDKFAGLADLFGVGCEIVYLDTADFPTALRAALDRSWHSAPALRDPLLQCAASQINMGRAAYKHFLIHSGMQ